jgi:phage major head subunit gpT-like protein
MKQVVSNALLRDIDKGLQTAFNKGTTSSPNFISTLGLLTVKSNTAEELYGWLKDLPELAKNPDEIKFHQVALEGHSIRNNEFKVGIEVPRTAIEDDQYGMFSNIAQRLGQNGQSAPDYEFLSLLSLLFTDAKAYTGKSFFATDHKIGNVTFSNKMLKKLSATNFEEGYAALRGMKKGTGQPLFTLLDPSKVFLLVGENYESTADSIVKLDTLSTGGRNPNYNKAKVVVIPGLGHSWMIFDCSDYVTPIIFQDRIPLELTTAMNLTDEAVLNADVFKWKARRRFALGTGEPRRAYGSTGANAA